MKNIFKLSIVAALLAVLSVSCNDDNEKQAYVMEGKELGGVLPKFEFLAPQNFDFGDMENTHLKFLADVAVEQNFPFNKLIISKSMNGGDTIVHKELLPGDMPQEITITPTDAVEGLGISVADIAGGDYIDWIFTFDFPEEGYKFGDDALTEIFPNFRSYFICAFDLNETIGTYEITSSVWKLGTGTFEVIAGPEENQIIIKDMFGFGAQYDKNYDLLVTVDPATGEATIESQLFWHTSYIGETYGPAYASGNGYILSCANAMSLTLKYCVPEAGGCFNSFDNIVAQRQ